ncbi:unnamed protein product, partial [Chrysoparadoxa australica]
RIILNLQADHLTMNPLLRREREQSGVCTLGLSHMLYQGKDAFERMKHIQAMVENDPVLGQPRHSRSFLNHTERYLLSAKKMARFHKMVRECCWSPQEAKWAYVHLDEVLPTDVHRAMVLPALRYQTSPEQRERWLKQAEEFRILGAYVQTELGHGSNVRALETTATFDIKSGCFMLHSPTLTSTKWWPGGLGKTATHCILMARLITKGKDHGVQPFFIQIRDLATHEPLPGITIGDIGPKLGFQSTDNGFMRFNSVGVPRDSLLNGVATVSTNGTYKRVKGGEYLAYGAMLDVRANIVQGAVLALGKAVTIAVRFSAVRLQGYGPDGKERQVLSYPRQQQTLFPLLAYAYALYFTGQHMREVYESYLETLDMSVLPYIHATSSGLKALITQSVADGIESCRKMCGGHGYSAFSALPEASNSYLALPTLEGTQQVLEPQTGRFLLKALDAVRKKQQLAPGVQYLAKPAVGGKSRWSRRSGITSSDLQNPSTLVELFEQRAAEAVKQADAAVKLAGPSWLDLTCLQACRGSAAEALVTCSAELGKASWAHCQLHILVKFVDGVEDLRWRAGKVSEGNLAALDSLVQLYALATIEKELGQFREGDIISASEGHLVHAGVAKLCSTIRKDAVNLVDGFAFSDWWLASALGRYDGDVYNTLMAYALEEPLNSTEVAPSVPSVRELVGVPRL